MVILFYTIYFIEYTSPPQTEQNTELRENVGVDDNITVTKFKVFKFRIIPYYCNSSAEGYNLRMMCKA